MLKVFLFALLCCCYGTAEDYWNNFGSSLSRKINNQVRDSLKGLDNLGSTISQTIYEGLKPLTELQTQLRQLDLLGDQINQGVYNSLKPVRELEFKLKIKHGEGGTTVAIAKDKAYIILHGVFFICNGKISHQNGVCNGSLSRVEFSKQEDFCFANIKSVINDWICLGIGAVSSGIINGKVYCSSNNNSPTVLMKTQEYLRLCGYPVTYKYYTKQQLGEYGSDVQCTGDVIHVCTYTDFNSY